MATNPIAGLIPRGSLGLKLLLVCLLVLVMGIPLLVVGGLVAGRESRAREVTAQIGAAAGGSQVLGGPMLLVPYTRTVEVSDDQGRTQRRLDRGNYVVFPETGSADTNLTVQNRRRGIYRAAIYSAEADFDAAFKPSEALAGIDESYRFDWGQARIVMFVSDSRAIRNAAELRFADGATATMEPISDLSLVPAGTETYSPWHLFHALGAAADLAAGLCRARTPWRRAAGFHGGDASPTDRRAAFLGGRVRPGYISDNPRRPPRRERRGIFPSA